jgi:hypothetical protein
MNTLYFTCGLPGSGKTTIAKLIEQETSALRLTGDDWMHQLYPGISTPEAETGPNRGRVESLQWQIALRALTLGCNVVVDWGGVVESGARHLPHRGPSHRSEGGSVPTCPSPRGAMEQTCSAQRPASRGHVRHTA